MTSILYVFNPKLLVQVLYGNPFRILWIIFFSLLTGFWIVPLLQADSPSKILFSMHMIAFFSTGIILFANPPIREEKPIIERVIEKQVFIEVPIVELTQPTKVHRRRYGVVYIMRRNDGILKFGKTYNLRTRIGQHRHDYRAGFIVIASWIVPDVNKYEGIAIDLTRRYAHSEGKRRELRQMSESELGNFVLDFTNKVQNGFQKAA